MRSHVHVHVCSTLHAPSRGAAWSAADDHRPVGRVGRRVRFKMFWRFPLSTVKSRTLRARHSHSFPRPRQTWGVHVARPKAGRTVAS